MAAESREKPSPQQVTIRIKQKITQRGDKGRGRNRFRLKSVRRSLEASLLSHGRNKDPVNRSHTISKTSSLLFPTPR